MTDNWQLEEKVNELVQAVNGLSQQLSALLYEIETSRKTLGLQGEINTVKIRMMMKELDNHITTLDLSPKTTKPYKPKLITSEDETG